MKHTCKRLTALVLALAMCFSLLAPAWAADVEADEEATAEVVAEAVEEAGEEADAAEEAEAEVAAAEVEDEDPAEDEGDAVVSAQAASSGTKGSMKWSVSGSTLTISGSGAVSGVGEIDGEGFYDWNGYSSSIKSIVIGKNITGISTFAFGGMENLTSVEIGAGVTSIGDCAFDACVSLGTITIPDNVTSIGTCAFRCCWNLTSVTIGNGVTTIGKAVFRECTSLKNVTIGSGVTTIKEYAFEECTSLKSVTIPANVTTIESRAFGYNYNGTKISGFTISGYDDTAAQTYAESNGFPFVSLGEAAPTAPKISSVQNTSSGITVKWSKISNATGYYIYRKSGSGSYSKIATVTSGSTVSYTDTGAKTNGTKYQYKIYAYNNTGKSAASSVKTTYYVSGVSISSLKNVKTKKMTVKWKKNSKASGYQIQYSTSSSFSSYKTVTVTSYKTVSKTISKLTKGKKYYVRVRAYKTVSGTKYYSAWSSTKNVKISK